MGRNTRPPGDNGYPEIGCFVFCVALPFFLAFSAFAANVFIKGLSEAMGVK